MMVADTTMTVVSFEAHRVTPADRESLLAMYEEFDPKGAYLGLPPRLNPGRWLDTLSKYPNFIVRAEGRVVGHGVLAPCGSAGEVAVFVHQDYRRRGLGKLLLGEIVREAVRLGLEHVWGTTEPDNVAMLRLAYALGFSPGEDPVAFSLDLRKLSPLPEPIHQAA